MKYVYIQRCGSRRVWFTRLAQVVVLSILFVAVMYYFNQWLIDLPQLAQAYNHTSHVDAGRWGWDTRMDHGAGGQLELQSA